MKTDAAYQQSSATIFTEPEAGQGIVLHLETGEYHQLNPTACFIWKNLATPQSAASLASDIQRAYKLSIQEAMQDTETLLADMLTRQLIEHRKI